MKFFDQSSGAGVMIVFRVFSLRLMAVVAVYLALSSAQFPAHAQPSWCKAARSEAERVICATPDLWSLDECEDGIFKRSIALEATSDRRRAIDADERAWVARRDQCGSDRACLAHQYLMRARALDPTGRAACLLALSPATVTPRTAQSAPAAAPPRQCGAAAAAQSLINNVQVISNSPKAIEHGGRIEVDWRFSPAAINGPRLYLVGAMPDGVRFQGSYRFGKDNQLEAGPGFIALPGGSKAPYGMKFGSGRIRVVIPLHDPDIGSTGRLWIKPYLAGALEVEWVLVGIAPGCDERETVLPVLRLGPYQVSAGQPQIVVQDFVSPDLTQVADANVPPALRVQEIEISPDGRYRLEILPRRYRVFAQETGVLIVDRSGIKPRFSPRGRFVLASPGDTESLNSFNFELVDLVAGRVVDRVLGPIVGWSNGDALLLDTQRTYKSLTLVNLLVDPIHSAEGYALNRRGFFPGCGSCDAWTGSNILIDWDRLIALRGDDDNSAVTTAVGLASGVTYGDDFKSGHKQLAEYLASQLGPSVITLKIGWESNAGIQITHVGRSWDGYVDETTSLVPSQPGRRSQTDFLVPRRLAYADGRALPSSEIIRTAGLRRTSDARATWRSPATYKPSGLVSGHIADKLAEMGLDFLPTTSVTEIDIPKSDSWGDVAREWPKSLEEEFTAAVPALRDRFQRSEGWYGAVVAGWRFTHRGSRYLLLQHGWAADTLNGAHTLRFDLVAIDGAMRGKHLEIKPLGGGFSQLAGREHTVAKVHLTADDRLIVGVPAMGKSAIVALEQDLNTHIIDFVEPTLQCAFLTTRRRGLVVQGNCDAQFFVFDPASSTKAIISGRIVDDEVISYTPQGYYSATYEGAHFVHIAFPGLEGAHSFSQFAKTLDRPDVIRSIVEARRTSFPEPNLLPPPKLQMDLVGGVQNEISVKIRAASESGLSRIEIYADGRLEQAHDALGTHVEQVFLLKRASHWRQLSALAVDADGYRSRSEAIDLPVANAPSNVLHFLAVGIDDYKNAKLTPLKFAKRDAQTLNRALSQPQNYYGKVTAKIELDGGASSQRILSSLQEIVSSARPADTVLLFFAGHGGRSSDGRYYLMLSETDPDRLSDTALDWSSVVRILDAAKARVVVVIDACHSGETGKSKTSNDDAVAGITVGSAMVVLAASKGRQFSEEMAATGGGVFTQTLANVLTEHREAADTNRNGTLEISELYRSLKTSVTSTTAGRQTPWIVRRNFVGDAPLF